MFAPLKHKHIDEIEIMLENYSYSTFSVSDTDISLRKEILFETETYRELIHEYRNRNTKKIERIYDILKKSTYKDKDGNEQLILASRDEYEKLIDPIAERGIRAAFHNLFTTWALSKILRSENCIIASPSGQVLRPNYYLIRHIYEYDHIGWKFPIDKSSQMYSHLVSVLDEEMVHINNYFHFIDPATGTICTAHARAIMERINSLPSVVFEKQIDIAKNFEGWAVCFANFEGDGKFTNEPAIDELLGLDMSWLGKDKAQSRQRKKPNYMRIQEAYPNGQPQGKLLDEIAADFGVHYSTVSKAFKYQEKNP